MKPKKHKTLVFIYRLIYPLFDPVKLLLSIKGSLRYVKNFYRYNKVANQKLKFNRDLFPVLDENISTTPFDAQYFFQQIWAFEKIQASKVTRHVDIGSTYQMSGYISKICKAEFVDIRPIDMQTKNLTPITGNILELPYKDASVGSLSCLHVIEHIGLGRYDDYIDPMGSEKAALELQRVLAKGAKLYFSTPVGKSKVCFNAHRIFSLTYIIKMFSKLSLVSFSGVDDSGKFHEKAVFNDFETAEYSCGMFEFVKQ